MSTAVDISGLGLRKHVGLFADRGYEKPEHVRDVIQQVRSGTILVTSELAEVTDFIIGESVARDDVHIKVFQSDPWDTQIYSEARSARIRDYLFLSFLKFQRGKLLLFPKRFLENEGGRTLSIRMQDLMITAHQLGVVYEIIPAT